jgi:hypothetical protein
MAIVLDTALTHEFDEKTHSLLRGYEELFK